MTGVSQRLGRISGSATMAISTRARELRAMGREVVSFGAGEPDFPTPDNIVHAAKVAMDDPANHKYSANVGLAPLREAIVPYTADHSRFEISSDNVVVTNGAKQAIFQTFAALLDPGDEALLPTPHWVTYPAGIQLAGGVPISVRSSLENGFKVTPADLDAHVTKKTKLLVFVSPSNPTGAVYTAAEARAVAEWADERGIWVVADEIYQRLVYGSEPVAPSISAHDAIADRLVLINGVAKSYAMTGWRVGWLIAPTDVAQAAARFQSHATSNVNNVAQMAAAAALTGPQDTVEDMRQHFDRRRQVMFSRLSSHPRLTCLQPDGAFYAFPNVEQLLSEDIPTSTALSKALLEEAGVAVVPGESFGAPGFIRLSYALSDDDLDKGLDMMFAMFESL